ncbi:MAG: aminotransferase class I/II-fold pyridoxal phosphate-dependent enzyme [Firmicutes bacterium]|nr:aminotransferase class I/II-fold pyridoxal phosphate-dependent enzyme [Bacillota bacterium]
MILTDFKHNSTTSLYAQLYEYLKNEISTDRIHAGERLPSLRKMAELAGVSVTTVKLAYEQLIVEGYLVNRPQSGFYATEGMKMRPKGSDASAKASDTGSEIVLTDAPSRMTDPASFDFAKWKKCMTEVLTETPDLLLTESDRQGEPALREEVARYLYQSRGVVCSQEQVVISAGTQQLVNHVARLLKLMNIELVCTESPGYTPVRNIFRDWGLSINAIPVRESGIEIEKLPTNIRTAVYVCPQNQFPTGSVMPIGRRHQLLDWAEANDSLIIEDDYNSELRYPGMPVPALQGLDEGKRVVYIGTFSPTLFPAVRISYMVLPKPMAQLFDTIKMKYDQTSSKTEQLTLARFMREGLYQANLRRVRKLYSHKLREALSAIEEFGSEGNFISAENTQSGVNIILKTDTHARTITEGSSGSSRTDEITQEMTDRMIESAAKLGIKARGISQLSHDGLIYLVFYYDQIPLDKIRDSVRDMVQSFKSTITKGGLNMPSVYEVVRLIDGRPQFLPEHFERLENSMGSIGMAVPFTYQKLEESIHDLAEEGQIANHNIKLEVDVSGHSILYLNPTHYPSAEQYAKGVRTELFDGERKNPNIKMMDQTLRDATDEAIKKHDLYEVILVDRDGCITEGSRSNVFFIKKGEVYTSPLHQVLPGVTRRKIIEIVKDKGIRFHEVPINASDIGSFDAAFISGTSPKVLPIASIGEETYDVNDPLLRDIMRWYDEALPPCTD